MAEGGKKRQSGHGCYLFGCRVLCVAFHEHQNDEYAHLLRLSKQREEIHRNWLYNENNSCADLFSLLLLLTANSLKQNRRNNNRRAQLFFPSLSFKVSRLS